MTQLDLIRHSDPELARAYRIQAETEMHNPYFTYSERETRRDYYLSEARKYEPLEQSS